MTRKINLNWGKEENNNHGHWEVVATNTGAETGYSYSGYTARPTFTTAYPAAFAPVTAPAETMMIRHTFAIEDGSSVQKKPAGHYKNGKWGSAIEHIIASDNAEDIIEDYVENDVDEDIICDEADLIEYGANDKAALIDSMSSEINKEIDKKIISDLKRINTDLIQKEQEAIKLNMKEIKSSFKANDDAENKRQKELLQALQEYDVPPVPSRAMWTWGDDEETSPQTITAMQCTLPANSKINQMLFTK